MLKSAPSRSGARQEQCSPLISPVSQRCPPAEEGVRLTSMRIAKEKTKLSPWNQAGSCGAPGRGSISAPHFLFVGHRLQPVWPSPSSKRLIPTVANQKRMRETHSRKILWLTWRFIIFTGFLFIWCFLLLLFWVIRVSWLIAVFHPFPWHQSCWIVGVAQRTHDVWDEGFLKVGQLRSGTVHEGAYW